MFTRFKTLSTLGLILSHLVAFHVGRSSSFYQSFLSSKEDESLTAKSTTGAVVAAPTKSENEEPPMAQFDSIRKMLYKEAIRPASSLSRSKFSLEGWTKGTGGLEDADRLALGDLYLNAQSVFEYGLGESTLIAAKTGVPRYSGIDSDAVWVAQARNNSKLDHFRFNFADVGMTGAWGYPTNLALQKIQYNYQIAPLVLEDESFDVYLVDGRYRVACACVSFLHAIKTGGNMELVRVGVHDNDQNGVRKYDVLTKVADVVVKNKKLWVYKLKNNTSEEDIYNLWEQSRSKQAR